MLDIRFIAGPWPITCWTFGVLWAGLTVVRVQERQVAWLVKEYGNSQFVPMSALLAHLQQEIQVSTSAYAAERFTV